MKLHLHSRGKVTGAHKTLQMQLRSKILRLHECLVQRALGRSYLYFLVSKLVPEDYLQHSIMPTHAPNKSHGDEHQMEYGACRMQCHVYQDMLLPMTTPIIMKFLVMLQTEAGHRTSTSHRVCHAPEDRHNNVVILQMALVVVCTTNASADGMQDMAARR